MAASISNNFLLIFLTIIMKNYWKVKRLYSRDWYLREHQNLFSTLLKGKNLLLRKSIMDYWKGMSPIVLISSIHWWNGISPVMLISFICMFISFILEKWNSWKGNINEAILAIYTELKLYPNVKFQTGLSLIQLSCKHALSNYCVS